ncbi:alpha/beta hydrolase [Halogeometricum sp. S1BR25-6]|uniref:Alpha/beta hydrolase n=1 Tax=Halogeometricum salsisoli TaxID=2950536 RepID=A0ABU2G9A1_9EURY|nr:alpha/beta hydrolase [Halogeometricum sp. S1BR25-6]MDS0297385.1 alpha/beta hydrolase [Halogeometricum sp. S1BR25-6]
MSETDRRNGEESIRVERGREVTDGLAVDTYRGEGVEGAPIVVFVYGGAWESGARGQFSRWALDAAGRGPASSRTESDDTASEDFVAVELEYRLSDEATFPAQIRDVRACLSWVRENAERFGGDADRVAVVGHSAGAHLAMLAALAPENAFGGEYDPEPTVHAAVGISGPYDLRADSDEDGVVRRFLGGSEEEVPERYAAASPVTHVAADAPSTFLLHGEADGTVPVESSEAMAARLEETGTTTRLRTDAGADHVYLHSSYWYPEIRESVFSWLDERL